MNQPNVLVCLTQEAYNKFSPIVRPGGLLLTDARLVKMEGRVDARQVQLPMYQAVMDQLGRSIVFNICMLGAVLGLTGVVKPQSISEVLTERIPKQFLDLNLQALALGIQMAEHHRR